MIHCAWKIQLKKSKETYALDLTSAQYGFYDPVVPWGVYAESRIQHSIFDGPQISTFGAIKKILVKICDLNEANGHTSSVHRQASKEFMDGTVHWEENETLTVRQML